MSSPLKLKLKHGDIVRKISPQPWDLLEVNIKSTFGIDADKKIGLSYCDEDGDEITISSQREMDEVPETVIKFKVIIFGDFSAGRLVSSGTDAEDWVMGVAATTDASSVTSAPTIVHSREEKGKGRALSDAFSESATAIGGDSTSGRVALKNVLEDVLSNPAFATRIENKEKAVKTIEGIVEQFGLKDFVEDAINGKMRVGKFYANFKVGDPDDMPLPPPPPPHGPHFPYPPPPPHSPHPPHGPPPPPPPHFHEHGHKFGGKFGKFGPPPHHYHRGFPDFHMPPPPPYHDFPPFPPFPMDEPSTSKGPSRFTRSNTAGPSFPGGWGSFEHPSMPPMPPIPPMPPMPWGRFGHRHSHSHGHGRGFGWAGERPDKRHEDGEHRSEERTAERQKRKEERNKRKEERRRRRDERRKRNSLRREKRRRGENASESSSTSSDSE